MAITYYNPIRLISNRKLIRVFKLVHRYLFQWKIELNRVFKCF